MRNRVGVGDVEKRLHDRWEMGESQNMRLSGGENDRAYREKTRNLSERMVHPAYEVVFRVVLIADSRERSLPVIVIIVARRG